MNRRVTICVATTHKRDDKKLLKRAEAVGRIVAKLGCNLITGGGPGAMEAVARGFCETPSRLGVSVGVIPGEAGGFTREIGVTPYQLKPKDNYPNKWIEVPIFTHLPGREKDLETEEYRDTPKDANSRNMLNIASGDIIVVLGGGSGTQAELEISLGLEIVWGAGPQKEPVIQKRPVIIFVDEGDHVGSYTPATLPPGAVVVQDNFSLWKTLREKLLPFEWEHGKILEN